MWFIRWKVRSAISFDLASSTKVGSGALVPGSLVEGAGPACRIPADCKAPEMAWEITAVSSVRLNCKVDVAEIDSGRAMATLSVRRNLQELPVLVFLLSDTWKLR